MSEIKRKNRNTKYPFSSVDVKGTFKIKAFEYNSMLTSLRGYNARHKTNVAVSKSYITDHTLLITRIQ